MLNKIFSFVTVLAVSLYIAAPVAARARSPSLPRSRPP